MKIFAPYNNILYTLDDNNVEFKSVKNIFTKIKFVREILDNADLYYTYEMKESDTPEVIAHKLYGDPNRYWIVMFTNEMLDPYYDTALKYRSFDNYIIDKYGSQSVASTTLHHYEKKTTVTTNKNGMIDSQVYRTTLSEKKYDFSTGMIGDTTLPSVGSSLTISDTDTIINDADGIPVTINTKVEHVWVSAYDWELEQNEAKRKIKLVKPEYVGLIEKEFKDLLK